MNQIPITFENGGKQYNGFFVHVSGVGDSSVYHLYDLQKYFLGRITNTNGWKFESTPATEGFKELANFFGDYITTWK